MYWSQLKAGKDQGEYLNWSLEDVCRGEKLTSSGEMKSLEAALAEGHVTGTCKLDIFARIKDPTNCWAQADWAEAIERYFEVTNVWRCGFIDPENNKVHPITHDVDVARAVEKGLDDYSSRHPVSLKYCKRLWERSVFYAQRGKIKEVGAQIQMLEFLQTIFAHWACELAQIAAHAETLQWMLEVLVVVVILVTPIYYISH